MSLLDNLPHLCTAKRRTRTKGSLGGSRDSFTNVFANRDCWRQSATHKEIKEFDKRGISVTNKIYFTSDPGLDEQHIVVIIDKITKLEIGKYEVRSKADPDASGGLGVVYKLMVEQTTTGSTPE